MSNNHPQFLHSEKTQLVVIDIQVNLFKVMSETGREQILKNAPILIAAANELGIPILVSEQYPKGLGPTLDALKPGLTQAPHIEKSDFAATEVSEFKDVLKKNDRNQVVLIGMESHICVYQTALGLLERGYDVHVVADALATRLETNQLIGLGLMEKAGCHITSTETVLFQLLERAGTPAFKAIQKLIL